MTRYQATKTRKMDKEISYYWKKGDRCMAASVLDEKEEYLKSLGYSIQDWDAGLLKATAPKKRANPLSSSPKKKKPSEKLKTVADVVFHFNHHYDNYSKLKIKNAGASVGRYHTLEVFGKGGRIVDIISSSKFMNEKGFSKKLIRFYLIEMRKK